MVLIPLHLKEFSVVLHIARKWKYSHEIASTRELFLELEQHVYLILGELFFAGQAHTVLDLILLKLLYAH